MSRLTRRGNLLGCVGSTLAATTIASAQNVVDAGRESQQSDFILETNLDFFDVKSLPRRKSTTRIFPTLGVSCRARRHSGFPTTTPEYRRSMMVTERFLGSLEGRKKVPFVADDPRPPRGSTAMSGGSLTDSYSTASTADYRRGSIYFLLHRGRNDFRVGSTTDGTGAVLHVDNFRRTDGRQRRGV